MILTCPQCSTRYHVDPTSFGPTGRRVRCATCHHRWLATPPADAPKVVELSPAVPTPAPRIRPGAPTAKGSHRGSGSLVLWLVGVLVVLILISAVIGRNEIVAGFPASATIYQKLGFSVAVQLGLQFENVTSRRLAEGGATVLVVEGTIVNLTEQERPVPPVEITLLDDAGRPVQAERFRAEDDELGAGGQTRFSARLVNPVESARNFSVTFDLDS
jgi:predicted Zn finger-like uncharacterized protein